MTQSECIHLPRFEMNIHTYISDSLGISDARQQAMTTLTSTLTPWLTGTNPNALVYDKVYGGIISTNGVSDPNADYGNGYYNDHHFHYGYFVFAFAVIAKVNQHFFTLILFLCFANFILSFKNIHLYGKKHIFFCFCRHIHTFNSSIPPILTCII